VFGNSNLEQAIANTEVGAQVASYEVGIVASDPDITATQALEQELQSFNALVEVLSEGNQNA